MERMRRFMSGGAFALLMLFVFPCIGSAGVVLTDDDAQYTLDNGTVSATISKSTGDLLGLRFKQMQLLDDKADAPAGRWHYAPQSNITASVTIAPASNNGSRAEVAIRGIEEHDNSAVITDRKCR